MHPFNLGLRAHDIQAETPQELCAKMHTFGLGHMQFAPTKSFPNLVPDMATLTPGAAGYFGRIFAQNGIKISVLGCYVNIASADEALRRANVERFKRTIWLCREFGGAMVALETGRYNDDYEMSHSQQAYDIVRGNMEEMVAFAERFGVTVAVEAAGGHMIDSAQRVRQLLDDIPSPNFKAILDCSNLITPQNHAQQRQVMTDAFALLGDDIVHLHLKDLVFEGGEKRPVGFGKGQLEHTPIFDFAKTKPLISMTFENTTDDDVLFGIETVKRYMNA